MSYISEFECLECGEINEIAHTNYTRHLYACHNCNDVTSHVPTESALPESTD